MEETLETVSAIRSRPGSAASSQAEGENGLGNDSVSAPAFASLVSNTRLEWLSDTQARSASDGASNGPTDKQTHLESAHGIKAVSRHLLCRLSVFHSDDSSK